MAISMKVLIKFNIILALRKNYQETGDIKEYP